MDNSRYFKSIINFWKVLPNGDQIRITGYETSLNIDWTPYHKGLKLPSEFPHQRDKQDEFSNVEVFGPVQEEDFENNFEKAITDIRSKAFPTTDIKQAIQDRAKVVSESIEKTGKMPTPINE